MSEYQQKVQKFKKTSPFSLNLFIESRFLNGSQIFNGQPPRVIKFGKLNTQIKEKIFDQPRDRGMTF